MSRVSLVLASLAAFPAFAVAGTPMPTPAQQKQVTAQIRHNVERTPMWKDLVRVGDKPKLIVRYAPHRAPTSDPASPPVAVAQVEGGKSYYGGGKIPRATRQYTLAASKNGHFSAAGGSWNKLYVTLPATP